MIPLLFDDAQWCVINVFDVLTLLQLASSSLLGSFILFFPRVCFDKASVKGCELVTLSQMWAYTGRGIAFLNVIIQLWVIWVTDLSCACCSKCNTLWLPCILVYLHHRAWRNWFHCLFYYGCPFVWWVNYSPKWQLWKEAFAHWFWGAATETWCLKLIYWYNKMGQRTQGTVHF